MKKVIYYGDAEDVYHREVFSAFMNELVDRFEIFEVFSHTYGTPRIYHFTKQGLTLLFNALVIETPEGRNVKSRITAFGSREGIGEVEKIILSKNKELKSLSSTKKS